MARQLTRIILKVIGGAYLPDTGHTVTIYTDVISPALVATAVETPTASGQYLATWTEQQNYGYWYVDGVKKSEWGSFWLGTIVGNVNYLTDFNIAANANVAGTTVTSKFQMTSGSHAGYVLTTDADGNGQWLASGSGGGGSGTMDHAGLNNLSYAASSHTDFAGTAVVNKFTAGQHFQKDVQATGSITVLGNTQLRGGLQVTGSINGSTTVDAKTGLLLNGVNINTSGVLSNVAYISQANQFTNSQTVTGSLTVDSGAVSDGNRLYLKEGGGSTWAQNNYGGTYRLFKGEGQNPILASDGTRMSIFKGASYGVYNAMLDINGGVMITGSIVLTDNISNPLYVSQTTGWRMTGAGALDCRYIYVDEMHAKSFIADLEQALAGGQIVCKSVAPLGVAFTIPAVGDTSTLTVESFKGFDGFHVFVDGDMIRLRQFARSGIGLDITDTWGTVTFSGEDTATHLQEYDFLRVNGGAAVTGQTIGKGTLALDYGVSGNGYTEQNSIDGDMAENSPYFQVVKWTGAVYPSTLTTEARLGNLNGIVDTDFQAGALPGFGLYTQNAFFKGNVVVKSANALALQASTIMIGNITGVAPASVKITNTGVASTSGIFGYNNDTDSTFALRLDSTAQIAGWGFNATRLYDNETGTRLIIDSAAKCIGVYSNAVKMYYTGAGDYGITGPNFALGSTNQIAGWSFNATTFYNGTAIVLNSDTKTIGVAANAVKMYYTGASDYGISGSGFQLGSTNIIAGWAFNTTSLYDNETGVKIILDSAAKSIGVNSNAVKMYYTGAGDYGITGPNFALGSTNQIAGWSFNATTLYNGTAITLNSDTKTIGVAADAVKMYYTGASDYGISGPGFQLGSTNIIAGWTFTTSVLSKTVGLYTTSLKTGVDFNGLTVYDGTYDRVRVGYFATAPAIQTISTDIVGDARSASYPYLSGGTIAWVGNSAQITGGTTSRGVNDYFGAATITLPESCANKFVRVTVSYNSTYEEGSWYACGFYWIILNHKTGDELQTDGMTNINGSVDTGWVLCNRGRVIQLYFMGAGITSAPMGPHYYTITVEQERNDLPFCDIGQNAFQMYDSGEGTGGRLLRGIRYAPGTGLEIASSQLVVGNWKFEETVNGALSLYAWKDDAWLEQDTWAKP